MPKLKREATLSPAEESTTTTASGAVMTKAEQPPTKRLRVPHLNFSIESMMQPASQQQQQLQPLMQQQQQNLNQVYSYFATAQLNNHNNNLDNQTMSRSPWPGGYDAGRHSSSSSSSSSTTGTLDSRENLNTNNLNHSSNLNDCESLPSSRSSSRAFTPIPPRGNNSNHQPAAAAAAAVAAAPAAASVSSCAPNSRLMQVECVLDNKEMWDKFDSLNTEMIITKTGRRMFPVLKVQFHNLDPNARYAVSMDIVPVDNHRYRYQYSKSCWAKAGKADPSAEPRLYPHPDSPFNGDLLSRQVISFEKVKLTNNEMDKFGHIILNSMHKYQPRVHLIELKSTMPPASAGVGSATTSLLQANGANLGTTKLSAANQARNQQQFQQQQRQPQPQLDIEGYRTFVFRETVFTAVTAYQNQLITKMKIDKNPFAKGFRDSSRLSDFDRNDPFEYMNSIAAAAACRGFPPGLPGGPASGLGSGGGGPGGPGGGGLPPPGSLEAAMAAAAAAGLPPGGPGGHQGRMDQAYARLLAASAAAAGQSPWYPAVSGPASQGPFGPAAAAAAACSTAQAAQHLQTQLWLAAFSACLNNGGGGIGPGGQPNPPTPLMIGPTPPPSGMHHHQINSNISSPSTELNTTNQQRGDSRSSG